MTSLEMSLRTAKKIELDVVGISKILVADIDSESDAEDSDFENQFEYYEGEEEQASAQDEAQAATSGRASPTWGLPRERNINIHPFVGPAKCMKNSEAPHIKKDSSPLSALMLFFTAVATDQLVPQATLGQTSRTQPPTARHYASGHNDFHCLGSADGT
jgi:hypothetical protein